MKNPFVVTVIVIIVNMESHGNIMHLLRTTILFVLLVGIMMYVHPDRVKTSIVHIDQN